jgi:sugar lactone lactonase YvrE
MFSKRIACVQGVSKMKYLLIVSLIWSGAALAADNCAPFGDLHYVCGPSGVEDLVQIEGTRWVIGSGLAEPKAGGHLNLIDTESKRWEEAYPAVTATNEPDAKHFPDCVKPPEPAVFSVHGIALRRTGRDRYQLLAVNHGGREAIEFFDVAMRDDKPTFSWVGCVLAPPDSSLNSLATRADGGFIATQFYTPSKGGIATILTGAVTGGLLEWSPGKVMTPIPGTDVSGANGIALSNDGKVIHVAAWGSREIVRFERRGSRLRKTSVRVDFAPDNLRWARDGQLLVAGQKFVVRDGLPATVDGWKVMRIAPATLKLTSVYEADGKGPLQGVAVAIEVGSNLWVGPYRGDRIGYVTLH